MTKTLFERMAEVQTASTASRDRYARTIASSGLRVICDDGLEDYGVALHVGPKMYDTVKAKVRG